MMECIDINVSLFMFRSMMQDLLRKTLRRQDMGPAVFLVATVWK